MTTVDSTARPLSETSLRDRLCERAIEHFGRFGFDMSMLEMAVAVDADVRTLTELFGSIEGLHAACDDYLQETIRKAKTEALTNPDPRPWFAQVADIESFAPMMSYLVRTLQSGGESARALFGHMVDNAERYLEDAVRAGTLKPTRDPKARAHFLTMAAGGGFLLYRQLHQNPSDMRAVLRDYARDVMLPALELYSYGLMTDDSMYRAFTARVEPR